MTTPFFVRSEYHFVGGASQDPSWQQAICDINEGTPQVNSSDYYIWLGSLLDHQRYLRENNPHSDSV